MSGASSPLDEAAPEDVPPLDEAALLWDEVPPAEGEDAGASDWDRAVIRPMKISSTAPILLVYRTTWRCFLKKSSTKPVNRPTARKGRAKPSVYTPTSR